MGTMKKKGELAKTENIQELLYEICSPRIYFMRTIKIGKKVIGEK